MIDDLKKSGERKTLLKMKPKFMSPAIIMKHLRRIRRVAAAYFDW